MNKYKISDHFKKYNKVFADTYEKKIVYLIRDKYTIDDELAILRQRDTKPEEFAEYNAYCEECKNIVKNGGF